MNSRHVNPLWIIAIASVVTAIAAVYGLVTMSYRTQTKATETIHADTRVNQEAQVSESKGPATPERTSESRPLTDGELQARSLALYAHLAYLRRDAGLPPLRLDSKLAEIAEKLVRGIENEKMRGLDLPNGKVSWRWFPCYLDAGVAYPTTDDFEEEWHADTPVIKRLLDPTTTRIAGHTYAFGARCWMVIVLGTDDDNEGTLTK